MERHLSVKMVKEMPDLTSKYSTLFIVEALNRAELERQADPRQPEEIQPYHIEKVLPKLMMDFFFVCFCFCFYLMFCFGLLVVTFKLVVTSFHSVPLAIVHQLLTYFLHKYHFHGYLA